MILTPEQLVEAERDIMDLDEKPADIWRLARYWTPKLIATIRELREQTAKQDEILIEKQERIAEQDAYILTQSRKITDQSTMIHNMTLDIEQGRYRDTLQRPTRA